MAARWPPRSEPQNSHAFSSQGHAAKCPLGRIVGDVDPAIAEEAGEGVPTPQHVVAGLGEIMIARQLGELAHEPAMNG